MRNAGLAWAGLVVTGMWAILGMLLPPPEVGAADGFVGEPLPESRAIYRDAIAEARAGLLEAFENKLAALEALKRLKASERAAQAQELEAERDTFREEGRIPLSPRLKDDVSTYRKTLQRAEENLRREFQAVATACREKGDAEAESMVLGEAERLLVETADLEAFPDRWIPLFNGRDLNGWSVERGNRSGWDVEAGALVARGGDQHAKGGCLVTERAFRDYLLAFEFQMAPDSDSGVVLRARRDEPSHLELNLRSFRERPSFHAFLFWSLSGNARDGLSPAPVESRYGSGAWSRAVIESRGNLLRVMINGRLAHSTDLRWFADRPAAVPSLREPTGPIGFQSNIGLARFRNIKIRGVARARGDARSGGLPGPEDATVPQPGHSYWVINVETGKALDVRHSSLVGGADGSIVQVDVARRLSQAWTLKTRRGKLQIINGNSNLLLNIPLKIQEDGAGLIQWPDQKGADNELWTLAPDGRAFRIMSTLELAITVDERGRVALRTPQGRRNELWRFVAAGP